MNPDMCAKIRIYRILMEDVDGNALLDLIPGKNASGALCFYDVVGAKAYLESKGQTALNTTTLNADGKKDTNTPSGDYACTAGPAV